MKKLTTLILISLLTSLVFAQEGDKILKGFDETEINTIITNANKIYDNTSVENEFFTPQPIDLVSELQNLKQFKDLKKKLDDIEKARKEKFGKDVQTYQLKYKTAFAIIDNIIDDARKLEVQYKTIKIYSDFSKHANPTGYKAFKDNLNTLKSDKFKANIELPEIKISNPYISMAYSMIGGIFSKNKKRTEVINEMTCITDFTMDFKSDLKSIDNQITYLSSSASNLSIKGQAIFTRLARAVAYTETFDAYRKNINEIGIADPLKASRKKYFDDILSKSSELNFDINNSTDIRTMELNFMQVVDFIKSYEILLFQGLSYYNSFIEVAKKYKEPNDRYPCINEDETKSKFEEMITKLEETRDLYSNAYNSVVSTSDKLKFYFGSSSN